MNIADAGLAFPVLAFTSNFEVIGADNLEDLTSWSNSALYTADYELGMELVDAEGKRVVLRDIQIIKEIRFFPFPIFLNWLNPQTGSNVDLIVEPEASLTFAEIKARVREIIIDKPEIYCLNYNPENDLPENAEQIAAIDDVDSLPAVLADFDAIQDFDELYRTAAVDNFDSYDGPTDMSMYRGPDSAEKLYREYQAKVARIRPDWTSAAARKRPTSPPEDD
jgi:hypothetical protein